MQDDENYNPEGQEEYYDESQYYEEQPQPQPQVIAPKKKRKANMPLIEVLVGSLILHLVAGILLGGLVIWQMGTPPEPEFEPPPEIEVVEPQKLEYKVKMKQQQKNSAKPRQQRIQVQTITDVPVPNIDIDVPAVDSKVAVGTGTGAGTGTGMGDGGGLGLGQTAVNFFGIKSGGEKIVLVLEAGKEIVYDRNGGLKGYSIIKSEMVRLIGKLPAGALFNVILVGQGNAEMFSADNMAVMKADTQKKIAEWVAPKNTSVSNAGKLNPNYKPESSAPSFPPPGVGGKAWVPALRAAFEQQADTIFFLANEWGFFALGMPYEEEMRWLKEEKGWDEKDEERYKKDLAEAKRKKSADRVTDDADLMKSMFGYTRPAPEYSVEDTIGHLEAAMKYYYRDQGKPNPNIYIVLLVPASEDQDADPQDSVHYERFKILSKIGRSGKIRVLEGSGALERIAERSAQEDMEEDN